jgi:hypothetical protein
MDLRVREDQRGFVADRTGILARAYAYRDSYGGIDKYY